MLLLDARASHGIEHQNRRSRLARTLVGLTGETMTEAVTAALRERLARERARREADADLPDRLAALSAQLRAQYDTHPVSLREWDEACGDDS